VLQDDCAGTYATNFIDNDTGGATSVFTGGVLRMTGVYMGGTAGANATARNIMSRAGRTVISFWLNTTTWASGARFEHNTPEVYLHKSSPAFSTNYGIPEHGVGSNTYFALGYYYAGAACLACKVRISGTDTILFDKSFAAPVPGWIPVVWEIDWVNRRVYCRANGVLIIGPSDLVSFSSTVETPITANLQATFHAHSWNGYAYDYDNMELAAYRSGPSKPIVADIYQLSSLAGRGIVRRATV
jgi:hypothetical protein